MIGLIVNTKLTGILEFLTWDRPWKITYPGTVVCVYDIRELFWDFATRMRDSSLSVGMTVKNDYFSIKPDESDASGGYALEFDHRGQGIIVQKREGFGFSNVGSYLPATMQGLNARLVTVEVEEYSFTMRIAEEAPKTHGVWYSSAGNCCKISDEEFTEVCRPGPDACIFAGMAPDGPRCSKFDPAMARALLHRLADGDMNAKRIGDCRLLGRKG